MARSPLISPGLITRLRQVAYRGLQTEFNLLKRMPVEENPYGDDTESWVDMGTFDGWFRSIGTARLEDVGNNVQGSIDVVRLHTEAEVVIHVGDLIGREGETFVVQDVNDINTYRVFTTAILRRRD